MKSQLLIYLLIILSCGSTTIKQTWKSEHRLLSFTYENPWKLLPTLDTKEQTLTGVIDYSDGKSYIIKMTNDVSKDLVSDDKLFQNAKETMLNANADNKLLREGDTVFHSQKTHLMVFYMNTIKWGPLKQLSFMSRNGKEYFSIQILFPIKLEDIDKAIPEEILRFDNTVKIEYK